MFISSFFTIEPDLINNVNNFESVNYIAKYADRIQIPSVHFETKPVYSTNPPCNIAHGINYSPFYIELNLIDFKPDLLNLNTLKENLFLKVRIFDHDGISEKFLDADYFEIKLHNCCLTETNINDFSHKSSEIQKIMLVFQSSYVSFEYHSSLEAYTLNI